MGEKRGYSVGIQQLPAEIVEIILADPCLDHHDICNVTKTCVFLRDICNNHELWKVKLQQRWPDLFQNYSPADIYKWKEEFQTQVQISHKVTRCLEEMSQRYFKKADIAEEGFSELIKMLEEHKRAGWFIMNSLRMIICDKQRHKNLTNKYYAKKALQFVQHEHLKQEWHHFLELPPEKQHLEKGAILVAQWFQTTEKVTESQICQKLDNMAEQVKSELKQRHPNVSLYDKVEDEDAFVVPANYSRLVLDSLNCVFFQKCGFCGNEDDYYNCENSYINKVLEKKTGIPISLCIVYTAIARRLGVICEPVNFPAHFLVKWKEHPDLDENQQYTFIDVFNKGKFLTQKDCLSIHSLPFHKPSSGDTSLYQAIDPVQVFERVARNLINIGRQHTSRRQSEEGINFLRQAVELLSTIKPSDVDNEIFRVRLYLYLGVNIPKALEILNNLKVTTSANSLWGNIHQIRSLQQMAQSHMEEEHESDTVVVKNRTQNENLAYSVGMIMKHKRYDYSCVIYGWDQRCTATEDWIYQMDVHLLPKKQHQPFYNVLVEDGSSRYAAEENLELDPNPKEINHPEVGKYFMEYCDTYYLPNKEKQLEYPEDLSHTMKLVQEFYTDGKTSN